MYIANKHFENSFTARIVFLKKIVLPNLHKTNNFRTACIIKWLVVQAMEINIQKRVCTLSNYRMISQSNSCSRVYFQSCCRCWCTSIAVCISKRRIGTFKYTFFNLYLRTGFRSLVFSSHWLTCLYLYNIYY